MADTKPQIPAEFRKIIIDMTKDILGSFPEQEQNLQQDLKNLVFGVDMDPKSQEASLAHVFDYCRTFYPVKFFDILYQNDSVFENDECEFLPGINFKTLWNENISDKTRETIWKYLQLVLFTIVSSISETDKVDDTFGDTAKLFEAINEKDFKAKLEETIAQMQKLFGEVNSGADANGADANGGDANGDANDADANGDANNSKKTNGINLDDLPNPSDIHDHVTNMMNGKLGKLAREIAEETAADLNINADKPESIGDVFKGLIHNPTKLMGLVKKVGNKLDEKIKTGDMKESELLEEASELIKKMKNMPGMGDIQSMLSKMGMNMGKGSGKVNVDAMQTNVSQRLKEAKNRERLLTKLTEKKKQQQMMQQAQAQAQQAQAQVQAQQAQQAQQIQAPAVIENLVFSKGEEVERSTREQATKNKKKKNKKKGTDDA
jgi:hypothetical protein